MTEITAQTKKFQKELNSGTSSLVLLSVLSRSKEPMYGYQIAKLLEDNGPDLPLMKQGTLYPVLRSLEENNLLETKNLSCPGERSVGLMRQLIGARPHFHVRHPIGL